MSMFSELITKIYHRILNLFFEFDVGIYEVKTSEPQTKSIANLKYTKEVICKTPKIQNTINNNFDLSTKDIRICALPSLYSSLLIRNFNSEFYQSIKLKEENLNYLCITKDYNTGFTDLININNEYFIFNPNKHKSLQEEICISKYLRTIEEILELEPYTHSISVNNILKIPIIKQPVKKDIFSKQQLDLLRTKLAAEAKCKKYSITVDCIFDKIPNGLYSEIELTKDNTISCTLAKEPQIGELQLLVTGKRKYDTQTTKTFVTYEEIGF